LFLLLCCETSFRSISHTSIFQSRPFISCHLFSPSRPPPASISYRHCPIQTVRSLFCIFAVGSEQNSNALDVTASV
jgi:hypothetical protein